MLTTVEAEVDVEGNVRLLEPLNLKKNSRAIVTILEERNGFNEEKLGNVKDTLEFIRENPLPDSARPTMEEIELQIKENRDSWD